MNGGYEARRPLVEALVSLSRDERTEFPGTTVSFAMMEAFYRDYRGYCIQILRKKTEAGKYLEAIRVIDDILAEPGVLQPHITCKRLDKLKINSWTADENIEFYLDQASLNFSGRRIEKLRGEIARKIKETEEGESAHV